MSYSRRQLYAMGEPLGECVTRKEGGRIIYGGGDGGGGGNQTQVTDLPEWAREPAKRTLAQAEAITDPSVKYEPYGKQRIAGFQDLQESAFTGAKGLQPSALGTQAGGIAGTAATSALGAGYDPFQMGQFTGATAGQYMNPYLEQAMAPQIREAQRASEIQQQADQARAVGAGAFGGSRQAIVEAERQRNLGTQIGDIRARGYASAFDQAQQQFAREQQLREQSRQYGAGLGMQGLQTALQGAGLMGQLGGQQFGQQKDIIGLQSTLGAQQQALEQQKLSQDYQDFLAQKKFPYQQVEFLSNILRGTPMGSVSTLYGAQPTMGQQIGALGTAAYGFSKLANGGLAEGGSVTSDENVESILSKLSDAQLARAKQIALSERDMKRVQMIDAEMAERTSMKTGLGSAFNTLPQEQQEAVTEMAGGGIVAFADGGYNPPDPTLLYTEASRLSSELPKTMYEAPTQEQTTAGIRAQRGLVQEMMGPDRLAPFMEELAAQRKTLRGEDERAKGLAALAAVAPMLEGRGIASIGRGVSKFGAELGRLEKENRDADRLLMASQVQLATAQQARADGQFDKAANLFNRAEELKEKGLAAKRDVLGRQATLQATMAGQALTATGQKYGTDVQAQTSRDVANINARASAASANRPGETERIMERMDRIMQGKESFGGKTGEAGVKLYEESLGKVGAARYGVGAGGEKPATAPNAAALENAVSQAVRADPRSKPIQEALSMAQLEASAYTRKGQEIPPAVQQRIDDATARANALREEHAARIRAGTPAPAASGAGAPARPPAGGAAAGRPSLAAFMAAARAANPGVSDAELRAYYDRKYGGQ